MSKFPRVSLRSDVNPVDSAGAIDFVNRVNWLFETWELEAMIDAFLPNASVFHFHGTLHGKAEIRKFLTNDYPYLIPGVSRHATNHNVDSDDEGVVVRYQNLLVRFASPEASSGLEAGQVIDSSDDQPAIWIYSPMMDRLSQTSSGWKIRERHVGGSTTNNRLSPASTAAIRFAAVMPNPMAI